MLCFARFVPSRLETLLAVASRKVKREIPNGNLHGVQLHERSREGQGAKIRGCKLLKNHADWKNLAKVLCLSPHKIGGASAPLAPPVLLLDFHSHLPYQQE